MSRLSMRRAWRLGWQAAALALVAGSWGCGSDDYLGGPAGPGGGAAREVCDNGRDDDRDGRTDCKDADCATAASCIASSAAAGGASWKACARATGKGEAKARPVDIIWAIDTSPSMLQEAKWVQDNLNAFARYMGNQKIDYRVVLIADRTLCVKPPLGGKGCTNGPRFRHIKVHVDSYDALEKLVYTFPKYRAFVRKGAATNFVVVTDDNSRAPASWFETAGAKLPSPGYAADFSFHSIVAFGSKPRVGCSTGVRIGSAYLDLTKKSGGVKFPVCQKDWIPIFGKLAAHVAKTARPPCSYAVPKVAEGKAISPGMIRVVHIGADGNTVYSRAASRAACTAKSWYLDHPQKPTRVLLCPQACQAMSGGKIDVAFGCIDGVD